MPLLSTRSNILLDDVVRGGMIGLVGSLMGQGRAPETFWQRWIGGSGIGRRCPLTHHFTTYAHIAGAIRVETADDLAVRVTHTRTHVTTRARERTRKDWSL